jgi:hypothetical protein
VVAADVAGVTPHLRAAADGPGTRERRPGPGGSRSKGFSA